MNLPRQPQVVKLVVSCNHEGDCNDAKELLVKFLDNRFDQVQSWYVADPVPCWYINCFPRAVND